MVRHQAKGEELHFVSTNRLVKYPFEGSVVGIFLKDWNTPVGTVQYVVDQPTFRCAQGPSHYRQSQSKAQWT
jgi:hypothetical protein